jgi:hypothetical protein
MELDLNIENYNLDDLLKLFSLSNDFNESDLKNAKQLVYKTHPDKSNLPKEYFIFFTKAFKYVYHVYEFKRKSSCTKSTKYENLVDDDENDKKDISNKLKEKKNFHKWFNTMFEKYKIEEEDDGYDSFLQSTEDIEINKVKNVSQLHQNFESYKSDKIKDIVVYKEISDVCNSLSYGGSNIVNKKLDNYSNPNIFSDQLNYEDVKKAHTETFIPVTHQDYENKTKYNSVFELNQERGNQNTKPLCQDQTREYLRKKHEMENNTANENAYLLLKEAEEIEKRNKQFMSELKFIL